jgi:hypothetical protein
MRGRVAQGDRRDRQDQTVCDGRLEVVPARTRQEIGQTGELSRAPPEPERLPAVAGDVAVELGIESMQQVVERTGVEARLAACQLDREFVARPVIAGEREPTE